MCRRADEIGLGKLHRDENMERMVTAKGFVIFHSVMRNY